MMCQGRALRPFAAVYGPLATEFCPANPRAIHCSAYGRLTACHDTAARITELLALPARRVGFVRNGGSQRRDEDPAPATRQKPAGARRVRRLGGGTDARAARRPA